MKAILLLCGVLCVADSRAADPAPATAPARSDPPVNVSTTGPGSVSAPTPGRTVPPTLPDRRKTRGAIPAIARSENPLQMINPLAPAAYGDGTEFLELDPITRAPQGVTLFSFSLPEYSGIKKDKPKKAKPAPRSSR
ncbi:MAG TPA: hypothetical protein PKM73_06250 [Verrucomicrobiota bacterium]|nr:hypothetical protein [Verrucomicrobiota bacterium]HNU51174.1 hypothetical protein [Verrucomicrobiota bacterium]